MNRCKKRINRNTSCSLYCWNRYYFNAFIFSQFLSIKLFSKNIVTATVIYCDIISSLHHPNRMLLYALLYSTFV